MGKLDLLFTPPEDGGSLTSILNIDSAKSESAILTIVYFEIASSRLLRIFDVRAFGSLEAKYAYFGLWGSGMGYDKTH